MPSPSYTVSKANLSSLTEFEVCKTLYEWSNLNSLSPQGISHSGLYQITRVLKKRALRLLVVLPPGVGPRQLRELSLDESPFSQLFIQLLYYGNGDVEPSPSTPSLARPAAPPEALGTPRRKASASSSRVGIKSAGISGRSPPGSAAVPSNSRSTSRPTSANGSAPS